MTWFPDSTVAAGEDGADRGLGGAREEKGCVEGGPIAAMV